jgi:hypothetical protein
MRKEAVTIQIDPESELARALATADDDPVILDSNGIQFRVIRSSVDDLWTDYDPDAVLAALEAAAGTLSPEEGERIKELIYRGREEGTRPLTRP